MKNTVHTSSTDKKSDLKVKIDILKHNIFEFKRDVDKIGSLEKDISTKYQAAKEIEELRDYQSNSLNEEVRTAHIKKDQLGRTIHLLKQEKFEFERENAYFDSEIKENSKHKIAMTNYQEELTTNRRLLEKEVQILKERYCGQDKNKLNNEKLNLTSQKHFEGINIELTDNNRKIISLQNRIDELVLDLNKYESLISLENFDKNNVEEFNNTIDKQLSSLKENFKISERKLKAISIELDNVKDYVNEAKSERVDMNIKLERLINILSAINQANVRINTLFNFLLESFHKKVNFIENEVEFLAEFTEMKNKILLYLKEINSYKNTIQISY